MPKIDLFSIPPELVLGKEHKSRISEVDEQRQRIEVEEILARLCYQPGVVLADEVGMGKTFVALAVSYCMASQSRSRPVIIMVPPHLIDKWAQDFKTFCSLYVVNKVPIDRDLGTSKDLRAPNAVRYGSARHSVEFLKLLDDPPKERCHLIFLGQGAMSRTQTDKWVRLALIREAIIRHGRRAGSRLNKVKGQIHRFIAELLHAKGEQRASIKEDRLWQDLLNHDPGVWKDIYNQSLRSQESALNDDPVPKAIDKALRKVDLKSLADALEGMPIKARGDSARLSERITRVRDEFKTLERELWKQLLTESSWYSPLLVMDEAHHLKNPTTHLARQLQSPEGENDLRTGDGAMAGAFDRMLFLTATPFQLGHHELVRVLERFGDVRWDSSSLGQKDDFLARLAELKVKLTESQRNSIALHKCWIKLSEDERPADNAETWWQEIVRLNKVTCRQKALIDTFQAAIHCKLQAEEKLKPWLIRHNKEQYWPGTKIARRRRFEGNAIYDSTTSNTGLEVPAEQILPFFLAARSAANPTSDVLAEALSSSYEAFRFTSKSASSDREDFDDDEATIDLTSSSTYLSSFDSTFQNLGGDVHPKIAATVDKAIGLWEAGEKVLIFTFYRQTCAALSTFISREIRKRIRTLIKRRFAGAHRSVEDVDIDQIVDSIQNRYFDNKLAPGREALNRELRGIINNRTAELIRAGVSDEDRELLVDVMRRFLRVSTTLARCFPIHHHDRLEPVHAVRIMLDAEDRSNFSWRNKFEIFLDFVINHPDERTDYLSTLQNINLSAGDLIDSEDISETPVNTLPNVQIIRGTTKRETRARRMRAFNTPFFPDILICTQVMGEGVDLQRYCRYVIHHDLSWNPSTIEQRTGRVDRIGSKAELRNHNIDIFLPFISGAADERQYRVMSAREQWFRIVMGQDKVANLIPCDSEIDGSNLPKEFTDRLNFDLALSKQVNS